MRALLIALVCALFAPAISRAETSLDQAVACFDKMLSEAKGGASFSSMVERYVSFSAVATRAVQVQKSLKWKNLSEAERKLYIAAIRAYFAAEEEKVKNGIGANDYVVVDSVVLRPRYHKKVGTGYQLAGVYVTQGGSDENFALYIVKEEQCLIYDARWRDAWLSKYVDLP